MAVKIRLRKMGSRNRPFYRMVVADSRSPNEGRFIENIGWYNPGAKPEDQFNVNLERYDYWTGTGAIASDTAKSLAKKQRKQAEKAEA